MKHQVPSTKPAAKTLGHMEMLKMNEALVLGSVRQHELREAAEKLNGRLQAEIAAREKTALELSEKARLLDMSIDAVLVRNSEGRILYWNHGAEKLYGWSRAEALGKLSHALLQTEFPTPLEQITEELHRNNQWTGELVHTKRDGQRVTVLARKALDRDAWGNPAAVLQTITDITERKQMENELRQARTRLADHAKELEGLVAERTLELTSTNAQLEAFVYSIAHDLRAPLRAMAGYSTMLLEKSGAALDEAGQDYAGRIKKSAEFMDAMLIDLLTFSRLSQQCVELAPVRLEKVVASVLSHLQNDIREKQAFVESSGPWPVVLAHEPTLNQVLSNLAGNALKFVVPGVPPRIRLRAEARIDGSMAKGMSEPSSNDPAIQQSNNPAVPVLSTRDPRPSTPASFVRIWIEDNGLGIAPGDQAQIFGLFTRLNNGKYPGTGIGLAIVQKGVERMGGRVGVESIPGHGSRFWLELKQVE